MKFLFSLSKNNFASIQAHPTHKVVCYNCKQESSATDVQDCTIDAQGQQTALCPNCDTESVILISNLRDLANFNRLSNAMAYLEGLPEAKIVAENDDVEHYSRSKQMSQQVSIEYNYVCIKRFADDCSHEDRSKRLVKAEVYSNQTIYFQKDHKSTKKVVC